jgi:serine/threonine protein kinase
MSLRLKSAAAHAPAISWYPHQALAQSSRATATHYRVLHKLASGGIADIFLSERVESGVTTALVALKRLRNHLRADAAISGMFADEIRLGRLCSHPNLVATLDDGEEDGQPYAVLEYVEGLDLVRVRDTLRARGERFTRGQAVQIAIELCKALAYLHALTGDSGAPLDIVHRDVTPPNVLLGVDGTVKLCDLGFAKSALQSTVTEPGLIKGKFSYLSPEAALEQPFDQRADLYAIGIMLWEMLTMRRLFHAKTDYETFKLAQQAAIPSLASRDADADAVLEEIVMKCLARDPNDRHKSAQALHDALAVYADWQELSCDLGNLVKEVKPAHAPATSVHAR